MWPPKSGQQHGVTLHLVAVLIENRMNRITHRVIEYDHGSTAAAGGENAKLIFSIDTKSTGKQQFIIDNSSESRYQERDCLSMPATPSG